jgi:hypothetical protein
VNQTTRPAVTQRPAATVPRKGGPALAHLHRHNPGQQDGQQFDDCPDDTERNVQILLDGQPGRAVQPQFAGYLHDVAERHAERQRHQQQAEEAGRLESYPVK